MRIATRLSLVFGGIVALLLVLLPTLLWSYLEFREARASFALADQIKTTFLERTSFRDQYFLYHEVHLEHLWEANKATSDHLLHQAEATFQRAEDRHKLSQLRLEIEDNAAVFFRIVRNNERMTTAEGAQEVYRALDRRLSSQLLLRASSIIALTTALRTACEQRVEQAYYRLTLLVGLSGGLIAILTLLVSLQILRLIRRRLVLLHQGVKAIAEGRLDYRLRVEGADEFSELGLSIDSMAERLQAFSRLLEEESARTALLTAQRSNQARFRAWFDLPLIGMCMTSPTKGWLEVNDHLCHMLGYERDELVQLSWADLTHPEDLPADLVQFERVLRREIEGYFLEKRFLRKDGASFPAELAVRCVRTTDGSVDYFVALIQDISERKKAEEALKQSNYFIKESQYAGRVGSYQFDFAADSWISSETLDEIFGIGPSHPRRLHGWLDIIHPEDREQLWGYVQEEVIGLSRPFDKEYRIVRVANREIRWVHGRGEVRVDAAGTPISLLGTIMDITERKRTDGLLMETHERLQLATASAHLGVWDWNLQTGIMTWDERMLELYGAGPGLLQGTIEGWKQALHPEDRERAIAECEAALQGVAPFDTRFRVVHGDGTIRWLRANAMVVKDSQGIPARMIGLNRDVTDLQKAQEEKAKLQAQLNQAQKLEGLGSLAGGVAHDMNNVLAAILGMASAQIEREPPESSARKAFGVIIKAAERGGHMVKTLLNFARKSPVEVRELDMNELLREEISVLLQTTLSRVQLELELASDLRPIHGDANTLTHAVMNLCINSIDAMPDSGTLTLRTANVDNDWIEVRVEDTGSGMPREVLARALDPFFTTKGLGKGTGLGLSLVHSSVMAHRGQMEIESKPGQGTCVRMRFPACTSQSVAVELVPDWQPGTSRDELRVLVVDDDEMARLAILMILESLHHSATAATSGEEALAQLQAGLQPDVVLLDMNMPGLGGSGTLPRLRVLEPTVPVLLVTGRADQVALDLVAAHPGVKLLAKPFSCQDLEQNLRPYLPNSAPE